MDSVTHRLFYQLSAFHAPFSRSTHQRLLQTVNNSLSSLTYASLPHAVHRILTETNPILMAASPQDHEYHQYEFEWRGVVIRLIIASASGISLKKLVYYLCLYLSLIHSDPQSHQKHARNLNLVLMPIHHQKTLPDQKRANINVMHVNGGVNWLGYAMVYRHQEFYKVLLHELLHYYGIDDAMQGYSEIERKMCQKYGIITSRLGLNEAYNDTIACLLVCAVHAYQQTQKTRRVSLVSFTKQFVAAVSSSTSYMFDKCSVLLRHFDLYPVFPFPYGKFKEDTHVFSYYFCKAAIFCFIEDFFRLRATSSSWTLAPEEVAPMVNFIQQCLDDPRFMTRVGVRSRVHRSNSLRMLNIELR